MTHDDVLAQAKRDGWRVEHTRGGHLRLRHPAATTSVVTSSTASDWRAGRNLAVQLRRALPPDPAPDRQPRPKRRKRRRRAPSRGYSHPNAVEQHAMMMARVQGRLLYD